MANLLRSQWVVHGPVSCAQDTYASSSGFVRDKRHQRQQRLQLRREPHTVRDSFAAKAKAKISIRLLFSRKLISTKAMLVEKGDQNHFESNIVGNPPGVLETVAVKFEQTCNIVLTELVIKILDAFYSERHYARFYVLETIARVPYFAFVSVLHMYESFGWWRRADYLKVHFAESWNELHHLLIMESLGGDERWIDRFLAQHIAVFYYFMTAFMYAVSPRMAYHFSECVEKHAYSTYDMFIKLQGEELKKLPAPEVAVKYYTQGDLYLFDEFQTDRIPCSRRPKIDNLYDVFINIRDDEAEHCKTMKACQTHGSLLSPHRDRESMQDGTTKGCSLSSAECAGILDCVKKSISSPVHRA
uniref:Ubiquinol oxidase n=1 Tax=Wollemia nobilis TaxID=56998 RepID=A0A0C9RS96_9CONI